MAIFNGKEILFSSSETSGGGSFTEADKEKIVQEVVKRVLEIIGGDERLYTFTIDYSDAQNNPKTYYCTDGMTWREWIDSEYNTDGFVIVADGANYIIQNPSDDTCAVCDLHYEYVRPAQTIVFSEKYIKTSW